MAVKGTESKAILFNKLMEIFPDAFWEDEGKILRVPMNENGAVVEIKVSLTAAKNILGAEEVKSAFNDGAAAVTPTPAKVTEVTEEEKANVAKLIESLNLSF